MQTIQWPTSLHYKLCKLHLSATSGHHNQTLEWHLFLKFSYQTIFLFRLISFNLLIQTIYTNQFVFYHSIKVSLICWFIEIWLNWNQLFDRNTPIWGIFKVALFVSIHTTGTVFNFNNNFKIMESTLLVIIFNDLLNEKMT